MDRTSLQDTFAAAGQDHVFAHWDSLSNSEQDAFLQQLAGVDLEWRRMRNTQYRGCDASSHVAELSPAPVIHLPRTAEEKDAAAAARATGEEALRAGRACAFLVAGGQGTRLGFDGPKGCYPLGPVTERTLSA